MPLRLPERMGHGLRAYLRKAAPNVAWEPDRLNEEARTENREPGTNILYSPFFILHSVSLSGCARYSANEGTFPVADGQPPSDG